MFMILLAPWPRAHNPAKWYSTTNAVLALLLLILAILQHAGLATALLMFWGAFWAGILVPVIASWGGCTDWRQWRRRPNETAWRA